MRASFLIVAATVVVLFAMTAAMDIPTEFKISSTVWSNNKDAAAKCQKQIKKQQQLFACQRYLLKSSKMSPSTPSASPSSPSMTDDNNQAGINWREEFPQCCEQLEKISEKCRCTAVEEVLQQLKDETEESGWEGVDIEEMLLTAKSLPNLCRMKPQYCYIETGPSQGGM